MPSEEPSAGTSQTVTCLDCGRTYEKEIAAAWHEDQTGHDNWSDVEGDNAE